jgi:hypothetical protein
MLFKFKKSQSDSNFADLNQAEMGHVLGGSCGSVANFIAEGYNPDEFTNGFMNDSISTDDYLR